MSYQTNLGWVHQLKDFSAEQRKILLALSDDRYKWRAMDRLQAVTGLDRESLDTALTHLMTKDLIRPAFSAKYNIIFGLRERVDA